METVAVVLEQPGELALRTVALTERGADDIIVDVDWTGISSGTERLLWSGRMPHFPGMGYPLVPGYETVGHVSQGGHGFSEGDAVFIPGANCYEGVRGLFGGAAARLIVPASRAVPLKAIDGEKGTLLALAATAYHAIASEGASLPTLIVGHGILGRLIARITLALGGEAPIVWEKNEDRRSGSAGYSVINPSTDESRNHRSICDASGAGELLDTLISRLAKRGEVTLAGFYEAPLSFAFPPAFMREARLRIAAEFTREDTEAVTALVADGLLSLDGLITNRAPASEAASAYRTAFTEPACIKMVLDWRKLQ
ncbi:chlorophyll synthesis pathway protein BchC [Aestuariivirga sp.]|uniref:chlorophyll synthesis pathway protein BchC n=1 Tax=Aestuariivirga sp. TaxID=2650926 RepID=UPI003593EA19